MIPDSWEEAFHQWQKFHRVLFSMNGPVGGPAADLLFEQWEFLLTRISPTAEELIEASCWMAMDEDRSKAPYYQHLSIIIWIVKRDRLIKEKDEKRKSQKEYMKSMEQDSVPFASFEEEYNKITRKIGEAS